MNIYFRELKAHRKSLIIWVVAMVIMIIAGMGEYSAGVAKGGDGFKELMANMPKSVQNLYGVGTFDFTKALDYYAVLFLYLALIAATHAVMLGNGIIAKEERDKTVEFLLVKPVSRNKIITSKFLSALTMVVIFNLISYATSYFVLNNYSKETPFAMSLFKLMLAMLVLQIVFTILGALIAACLGKHKLSTAISTGILLLMFMLAILIDMIGTIDFLRYFTLFKYVSAKDILKTGYDIVYPIILGILIVGFTYGTYFFYHKRDLRL